MLVPFNLLITRLGWSGCPVFFSESFIFCYCRGSILSGTVHNMTAKQWMSMWTNTYLSGHLKREVIGLESLVSSGKCILEGVKHWQIIDISLFLCISVWSIGETAPEEAEKRDDSQRSTLFIEKPQSGTVSVGKCFEQNQKPFLERETQRLERCMGGSGSTQLLPSATNTSTDFSWMWTPLFEGKTEWRKRSKNKTKQNLKFKTKSKCYSLVGTMAMRYGFWELIITMLLAVMLLIGQEDLHDGLQRSLEIPRSTFILCSCR